MAADRNVFLVEERNSQVAFVCKFFGFRNGIAPSQCRRSMNLEYTNLNAVRGLGFDTPPVQVVRPLGKHAGIHAVLVEEVARGRDLDHYITRAITEGRCDRLRRKLGQLAVFLRRLHDKTVRSAPIDFTPSCGHFMALLALLRTHGITDAGTAAELGRLCSRWEGDPQMRQPSAVVVHGDATPTNFLFDHRQGVTAIDLERMRESDRACELGSLAAERRHHFAWPIGKADEAEPYIGHLFATYCDADTHGDASLERLTDRSRFYMALAELRIARNPWLPMEHRQWLADEAARCLT